MRCYQSHLMLKVWETLHAMSQRGMFWGEVWMWCAVRSHTSCEELHKQQLCWPQCSPRTFDNYTGTTNILWKLFCENFPSGKAVSYQTLTLWMRNLRPTMGRSFRGQLDNLFSFGSSFQLQCMFYYIITRKLYAFPLPQSPRRLKPYVLIWKMHLNPILHQIIIWFYMYDNVFLKSWNYLFHWIFNSVKGFYSSLWKIITENIMSNIKIMFFI